MYPTLTNQKVHTVKQKRTNQLKTGVTSNAPQECAVPASYKAPAMLIV